MNREELSKLIKECVQEVIHEQTMDEGWKDTLGALGLAGSMLFSPMSPDALAAKSKSKPAITKQAGKSVKPQPKNKNRVPSKTTSSPKKSQPTKPAIKNVSTPQSSRGIRNNNPGNIKTSKIKWQGAVGNDGSFVTFKTPEHGIRALSKLLNVYSTKYNLNTPSAIINRWAPSVENQTQKYANFVARKLGTKPDAKIDMKDKKVIAQLVKAIIEYENGSVPYDETTIMNAINQI